MVQKKISGIWCWLTVSLVKWTHQCMMRVVLRAGSETLTLVSHSWQQMVAKPKALTVMCMMQVVLRTGSKALLLVSLAWLLHK